MHQTAYAVIPDIYSFIHHLVQCLLLCCNSVPFPSRLKYPPPQLVLHSLQSDLSIGYLDDFSLGGSPETVARDITSLAS